MPLIPLIQTAGYFGIFLVLFAESGLLVGIILPGDTLLFAAGLLAAKGVFNIWIVLIGTFIAGIAGDSTGYWTGKKLGPKLFTKEHSFLFRRSYVDRARLFFNKHGKKTIFIARFVPIVRTLAPMIAGVAGMEYLPFLIYNVMGSLSWTLVIGLLAYFLGTRIENIDAYILPIIGIVLLISFLPLIKEIISAHKKPETKKAA